MSSASDFIIEKGVLKKYVGPGGDVVIPEGVTSIGKGAFRAFDSLTSVTIPDGVTSIGDGAFETCSSLKSVTIPKSVTSIGLSAFHACISLASVAIPDSVTSIGNGAFWDCNALMSALIPDNVTKIGSEAFRGCSSLTSITIPGSVKSFGAWAFGDCSNLMCVTILDGVTSIGNWAFCGCWSLTSVVLPESLTKIGDGAFRGCDSLTSMKIPSSVAHIGEEAFVWCRGLTNMTIPEGVISIGDSAFDACSGLTSVTIPDSATKIGNRAFWCCSALQSVTIPDGVTSIGPEAFGECSCLIRTSHWSEMLADAVRNRDSLRIKGTDNLRFLTDDPISAFPVNRRRQALLGFIEEEGTDYNTERAKSYLDYARKNAGKLAEAALDYPKLLYFLCEHQLIQARDIDAYTAEAERRGDAENKALLLNYQNKLGTEKIVKARKKKEKTKEQYTDALTERIAARDPSKGIEGMTFVITGKLSFRWKTRKEVQEYLESYGAVLDSVVTKKTDYLVTNDTDSSSEKNRKAKAYGVTVLSEDEFNEMIGWHFRDAPQITTPVWLRAIPNNAFAACSRLKSIMIPDGVKKIGDFAFANCSSLTSVTIPKSVMSIGGSVFWGCKALTSVTIPKSVKKIENSAFHWCDKLTIHAPAGSYAEQYAKEHGILFVAE